MVYQELQRSKGTRSQSVTSARDIYKFAVIIEPCDPTSHKERHSLVAYFHESPFPFEIDEWAKTLTGNDYRVAECFLLEEISL